MTQEDKYDDKVSDKFFYEKELVHHDRYNKISPKVQEILNSSTYYKDYIEKEKDPIKCDLACPRHNKDMIEVLKKENFAKMVLKSLTEYILNDGHLFTPSCDFAQDVFRYIVSLAFFKADRLVIKKFADIYDEETVKANKIK